MHEKERVNTGENPAPLGEVVLQCPGQWHGGGPPQPSSSGTALWIRLVFHGVAMGQWVMLDLPLVPLVCASCASGF